MLADRIARIGFSPTLRITAKAKAMVRDGIDVIDLSVGEPDFQTPEHIVEAAAAAMARGETKYTPTGGTPELKRAICEKLRRDNELEYAPDEVIVGTGAKQCLYNAAVALFNKGEECLVPTPSWVSYGPILELAKAVPVFVPTREEDGFRLSPDEMVKRVSANTKAIILNSPCNPTGAAYDRQQLLELCEAAVSEGLLIIADEIYEKLVYDGFRFVSVASLSPRIKSHTLVINGVSKAYAMTGWRLGYAAGPKELVAAMTKVQSHTTSNASSVSQAAAAAALSGPQGEIGRMVSEFGKRRNVMLRKLLNVPNVTCHEPQGAFYLFPNMTAYYDRQFEGVPVRNSYGMAYYLLKRARVAIVPGDAFGDDRFIRLSYATSLDKIEEAMDRITSALAELKPTVREARKPLNNTVTKRKAPVPFEPGISVEMREALAAECENFLTYETYSEWNVNIAGLVVQLRTNSPHLMDFFVENFYPAPLEGDVEPHAVVYAVNWLPGREPRALVHVPSRTAFYLKSAYYAQLRSLALGLVSSVTEQFSDVHLLSGTAFDSNGRGMLVVAPPGTGGSTHVSRLAAHNRVRLVSYDGVFARVSGREAVADCVERKFLIPTDLAGKWSDLEPLCARSKCENVAMSKDECQSEQARDELDGGAPYTFIGSSASVAMLDPYWLGGPDKHVKRTRIDSLVLLRRDDISPPHEELDPENAFRTLSEGRGASSSGGYVSMPYFNPHILSGDSDRNDTRERFYKRLLESVRCHAVNTGAGSIDETQTILRGLLNIE